MRSASVTIRFLGMLLCLLGLSSLGLVWGQNVSIRRACAQLTSVGGNDCKGEPTTFRDTKPGVKSWTWSFDSAPLSGTGTPPSSSSTTSYSVVQHYFSSPGSKNITLKRTFANGTTEDSTFTITVMPPPKEFQNWVRNDTICKGEIRTLDPYPNGPDKAYRYEWNRKGEITQTISVSEAGCYSVEVIDNVSGCSTEDRVQIVVCPTESQPPATKWYFGSNAGLDFMGGAPRPIDDSKLSTIEGSAAVSDKKGDLLFYTDGIKIYDKDGNVMGLLQFGPDGKPLLDPVTSKPVVSTAGSATTTLGGSQSSTQSALIVPKGTCRGCEYLYYVYTTTEINGTRQLTYSVVDMRKNDGKGAIVDLNLPVVGTSTTALSTERTTAVKNPTDSTTWVITRDFGGNTFRITHVTKNALPVQTTVAAGASQTATVQGEGYLKVGPAPAPASTSASSGTSTTGVSGTSTTPVSNTAERTVAMIVPGIPSSPGNPGTNNKVELFTFNVDTGTLVYKRAIDLGPSPPKAYGVEFSPDGQSLYVSLVGDPSNSNAASSYIYRYDLSITDPSQLSLAQTEIAASTTQQFGALQIGPDGRIYVAIPGQTSLGVIENPDADGILEEIVFNPIGQSLGGKTGQLGLPNAGADDNSPPSGGGFGHEGICLGEPTQFNISPYCPGLIEEYTINFNDGTAPYSGTATQTTHTYAQARPYSATLTVQIFRKNKDGSKGASCTTITAVDELTIASYPQNLTLNDQTVCRNPLATTLAAAGQAQNYVWVFAGRVVGRAPTFTATRTGTYTVFGYNESTECFRRDDAQVIFRRPFPLTITPDTVVCQNSTTTIAVLGAPAYNQFQWSSGQTTKNISVSRAGTYSVTAQYILPGETQPCINSGTVSVSERPNPTVTSSTVGPKSCTTLDGAITLTPNGSNTLTYAWTSPNNTPLVTTGNSLTGIGEGAYGVRFTDTFSCSAAANYTLKSPANTLALSLAPRDQLCSRPGSGSINATVTGGRAAQYFWRDATNALISSASVLTGINSGTYTGAVSDAGGCTAVSQPTRVGLDPTGFANLGPPQDKCSGSSVTLNPESFTIGGNTYQWSNGQTTNTISVTQPGDYSVRVSNPNGCTGAAGVRVSDRPSPNISLAPEYRFCVPDGGSTTLAVGGPSNLTYVWSENAQLGRTLPVNRVGNFLVRATDPTGCSTVAATRVVDFCEPRVFIPEAFTPNGDKANDLLEIRRAYTSDFELKIFNRWGEVVFVSNDPENVMWDGTYRGMVYPPMMYAYVISYGSEYDPEMPRVVRRGSVLLIR